MESEGVSSCSQDLPLFHTVSQNYLIHFFLLCLFNAHFNIILPHMLVFKVVSCHSGCPQKYHTLYAFLFSPYMPHAMPISPSLTNHLNSIWQGMQIKKLSLCSFLQTPPPPLFPPSLDQTSPSEPMFIIVIIMHIIIRTIFSNYKAATWPLKFRTTYLYVTVHVFLADVAQVIVFWVFSHLQNGSSSSS